MAIWFEQALVGDRWETGVRVAIEAGRIQRVALDCPPQPNDDRHAIGLPGLPNLHSHAFQRAMAGLGEVRGAGDDDFWSWRELMYRFVERIGPDDLAAIAAFAYAEMLEAGFTRVGEFHYLHHDPAGRHYAAPAEMSGRIAEAAARSGIGLTLLPVFYAQGGFGGVAPGERQRRFVSSVDEYARLVEDARHQVAALPDVSVGIAPHSLRAVTPEQLRAVVALAPDGPIHIHAAEQEREVADCLAWSGRRPVEWLLAEHAPDARWCLVHATHVTPAERAALARSGAVAGLCPITEANLGDGIFPAADYLAEGGTIGIGSDSNVSIEAASELRLLEYGQRLQGRRRCVLAPNGASVGGSLFREALRGGARALGAEAAIAVGASADLVSLRADDPSLAGRRGDALLDSWTFASRGAVDCVWRRGDKRVEAGRHVESERIRADYAAALARILA